MSCLRMSLDPALAGQGSFEYQLFRFSFNRVTCKIKVYLAIINKYIFNYILKYFQYLKSLLHCK